MIDANIAMLEIEVGENNWYAYGDPIPSSTEAYNILVNQGGINESVPPGTYTFTVERLDAETVKCTLEPKQV